MKTNMGIIILTVGLALPAFAKTNVKESLEQLKVNAENSEFNRKQYQDNLDVVEKNVEQSTKAITELRKLRTQLINNTKNVDKNKKSLADMEKEIAALKAREQGKIANEDKQIEDVRKILEKLEANKKKREENVLAYDNMTLQVQQEQKGWDLQVEQMTTLQLDIAKKEALAIAEKKNWEAKRKDYEFEAKKWSEQASISHSAYSKVKKLID